MIRNNHFRVMISAIVLMGWVGFGPFAEGVETGWREYEVEEVLVQRVMASNALDDKNNGWELYKGTALGSREKHGTILAASSSETMPVLELRVEGLKDGEYAVRAGVFNRPEDANDYGLCYLYGYEKSENARKYLLLGPFHHDQRPSTECVAEFQLVNAKVKGGVLRVFLGPVRYFWMGKRGGEKWPGRHAWLKFSKAKNFFGGWDYIKVAPVTPLPGEGTEDGGKFKYVDKEMSRVLGSSGEKFEIKVGGDFEPLMRSFTIEPLEGTLDSPKVLSPLTVDATSHKTLAESICRPGMSDQQKAIAVGRFISSPVWFTTTRPTQRGKSFYDHIKMLNVYGYGWCYNDASLCRGIIAAAGVKTRMTQRGHKWNEVLIGDTWRWIDYGKYVLRPDGELASHEEIYKNFRWSRAMGDEYGLFKGRGRWWFKSLRKLSRSGGTVGAKGPSVAFKLREGETFKREWTGEKLNENWWVKPRMTAYPQLGSGTLSLRLDSPEKLLKIVGEVKGGKLLESKGFQPETAENPMTFVIASESYYRIKGAAIRLRFDDGKGSAKVTLQNKRFADESVSVEKKISAGKREPAELDFQLDAGDAWYEGDLAVEVSGANGSLPLLTSIETDVLIQCYRGVLPKLGAGKNTLTYTDNTEGARKAKVTFAWTERYRNKVKDKPKNVGWGPIIEISSKTSHAILPALTLDPSGKPQVVWQSGKLYEDARIYWTKESADGFSRPELVSQRDLRAWHPDIVCDAKGVTHFIWQGTKEKDWCDIWYRRVEGGRLTSPERVDDQGEVHYAAFPRLVLMPENDLRALWIGTKPDRKPYEPKPGIPTDRPHSRGYRLRTLSNKTWGPVSELKNVKWPTFVVEKDRLHMLCASFGFVNCAYKTLSNGQWSTGFTLNPAWGHSGNRPAMTVDEKGTLYAAWCFYMDLTPLEIVLRCKEKGRPWSRIVRLSDPIDDTDALYPVIAARNGRIHVAWMDHRHGHSEIYYKQFSNGRWTPDICISEKDGKESRHPGMKIDKKGDVIVVWFDKDANGSSVMLRCLPR